MTEPQVASPFPPGSTEQVIWVGADGRVLPGPEGAVRGETIVTYPDGRVESTLFTTSQPSD